MAAKSVIAGEYILQIAENGHVDVVRVFRNAMKTMKEIAASKNFSVEEKWNTQDLGRHLVKEFGDGKTAMFGDVTINKMPDGKIEIYQECKNTMEALRTISAQLGFVLDEKWNTQTSGAKLAAYLMEHKEEADKLLQTPNSKKREAASSDANEKKSIGKTKKYTIEIDVRAKGVRLLSLNEDEKEELLGEDLEDVYEDWAEEKDYEFYLAKLYLMPECDRFKLCIKDEDGNIVYENTKPASLNTYTYDEDDEPQVRGWEFEGVEDGFYLTRILTLKGCYLVGEFELEESFDESKLYILDDTQINDELMGNYVYPLDRLYYQRGEGYDEERDRIELEIENDGEEQYYDTYLMEVSDGDYWHNLQEED